GVGHGEVAEGAQQPVTPRRSHTGSVRGSLAHVLWGARVASCSLVRRSHRASGSHDEGSGGREKMGGNVTVSPAVPLARLTLIPGLLRPPLARTAGAGRAAAPAARRVLTSGPPVRRVAPPACRAPHRSSAGAFSFPAAIAARR